jgi:alkylation response protein AidB-like acyl-CoA dehydrogenase
MEMSPEKKVRETLKTLPGDDVRQIMWRFSDRYDLQMLVQSARSVARGIVARLVAEGARNSHEWTAGKNQLLKAFDEAGITTCFMDPHQGGFIEGPKNVALALVALELAWVDGGSATGSLAGNLALSPIHERGTQEQRDTYMSRCVPPQPGEDREVWRGAFSLTEPLPYVGVETGLLSGKVRIAEWEEGKEPILQVDKRGRFITNMGFANFVTAAVDTGDPRIKSSCMVILEESDPGLFDRGVPTRKLVHQLSSTNDPVFSLKVPASRIIGGYTVKEGVIIPRYSHGEIIEAVFRRTRVTVGLMTAAKLLSAVEPVIRYQRSRFRGGESTTPGTPRYDLGLQQKEDSLHRLVDVWATGEAAASLGFAAARLFDELDPMEKLKDQKFAELGIAPGTAQMKAFRRLQKEALEFIELSTKPEVERDADRYTALQSDILVQYLILDSQANVLCPACKLWNTGYGANQMRDAVSLVGGYGITEDCPGFLGHKWMDAQLEATYEGPEAVQRRQLSVTMTGEVFLAQYRVWIKEMRRIASQRPGTGACTLATAMELWLWTLEHLQKSTDPDGAKLYHGNRQGVTFPLADALCWLLAARQLILDVLELEAKGPGNPVVAEGLEGLLNFYTDLCHVQTTRAAGEAGKVCAELVYGYTQHPAWTDETRCGCYKSEELSALEGVIPGIDSTARAAADVIEGGETLPLKAGPCVQFQGVEQFVRYRMKLDGCLTGSRLAKDRAAESVAKVMIPEALDYPV